MHTGPEQDREFLLPPPAPPERKTALRIVIAVSTVFHLALLAAAARAPKDAAAAPAQVEATVRVLRGEVTDGMGEPGLRLLGYADVPVSQAPAMR